jgi:thymidine kinase
MTPQNPTFTVYTGAMFSSKTSKLLMELERFKYQHKRISVFKPQIDERYSSTDVVTHGGWSIPAVVVKSGADILENLEKLEKVAQVVAVDEAFMIPNIAEVLIWLYRNGVNIVVSTLDISATGKPFREVEKMLVWATRVDKCAAVCTVCGKDAFYTHKKLVDEDSGEIQVGGSNIYEARCSTCHPLILNHEITLNDSFANTHHT